MKFCEKWNGTVRLAHWTIDSYWPSSVSIARPEKFTVVLLSFKRIQNMESIVRSLLRCNFVEKIILSNNNPEYRIRDWVKNTSDRLVCIDQKEQTGSASRYAIALEEDAQYFFCIDDDIFLYPKDVARLAEHLLQDPSVPHGMFGQSVIDIDAKNPFHAFRHGIANLNREVDALNRVLFFTHDHVKQYYRYLDALQMNTSEGLHSMSWADDMLLSFCGIGKPQSHAVGPYTDCPTQGSEGIAQWRMPGFFAYRRELFRSLTALKTGGSAGDPQRLLDWYYR